MIVMNQSHSSSFHRLPTNQRFLPFLNLDDNLFRLRGYELSLFTLLRIHFSLALVSDELTLEMTDSVKKAQQNIPNPI